MFLLSVMVEMSLEKENCLNNKQKVKRRMKMIGSVEVPQEAFMAVLKID